ncbi:DUF5057 domain-containing protein [Peribacillus sp. SCS-155]|uniref:DUF5057 domain-containing protein n=1 Tax=Peribacillus sedimenti TaxID=3115297 RepID=UPI0039065621
MKKIKHIFVAFIILCSVIFQLHPDPADAGYGNELPDFSPKYKILEIIDVGNVSKLRGILDRDDSYEITTMTMKKFVAMREELDGQYDLIAIMEGNYNPEKLNTKDKTLSERSTAHNTTGKMNDITVLKANEIIDQFINKDQPVILDRATFETGTILYNKFRPFLNDPRTNIIEYNSHGDNKEQDLISHLKDYFKSKNYKERPRFTINSKPGDRQYGPGDTLNFEMNVLKPGDVSSRDLEARLYIDSDFNDRYDPEEIVIERRVTSKTVTLSYQLPSGYSGVRYWKLELLDKGLNLKDSSKGMIYFKDQPVNINVLQVTKNNSDNSALTNENNMQKSFLNRSGEYNIHIDVTDINTFNQTIHTNINGKYDMVIFGFADVYNDANLGNNAVNSLKTYIKSGQSIMFTHDTIYKEASYSNNWVTYFKAASGQIDPMTNLGLNAPNISRNTVKVNSGLMTNYPFNLDTNIMIAPTHNQYYTLDLEDKDVIPWYNIIGSNRDQNDSWNHYYTYSKGNITYSGSGHTSTGFPQSEQKLFVNTMYRAFLGSNHAPAITVLSPKEGDVIPSNQNIELSYKVDDFDLKDKKFSTQVYLNGTQVMSKEGVPNGSTIVTSIDHKLPEGGNAKVKIVAVDSRGARAEKELSIAVEKLQTNLDVSREVLTASPIKVNDTISIKYTITPRVLSGKAVEGIIGNEIRLSSLEFTEAFPQGIEVLNSRDQTGSLVNGLYKKNLPDIVYRKTDNEFRADPVTFTVNIKATEKKSYVLNNSKLRYNNVLDQPEFVEFNPLTILAEVPLTGIEFPTDFVLNRGISKNFSLNLTTVPSDASIKEVRWEEDSGGEILNLNPETGFAEVLKHGTTKVKVTVTDVFGHSVEKTANVTVRIPVESFTVHDLTLNVGDTAELPISDLRPEDSRNSLEVSISDPLLASINKGEFTITGLTQGTAQLIVAGINATGERIEKRANITIQNVPISRISVTPDNIRIDKNAEFSNFHVEIFPSNATNKHVSWASDNSNIVRVIENGRIQGVSTGAATIQVAANDGSGAKAEVTVQVGQPLLGISVNPSAIEIEKGNTDSILKYVSNVPADATNRTELTFATNNDYYVSIDKNGIISANRLGEQVIAIVAKDDIGATFTAALKVKVVEPGSIGKSGSSKY